MYIFVNFTVHPMENLYESLYNDIFQGNGSNLNSFDVDTVSKISGQSDITTIYK